MSGQPFDPQRARAQFPALADGRAYLDGAAGTQVPEAVIDAISTAYREGLSNTGGYFESSRRAEAIVAGCREALADLTGGDPSGVVLGPNMTSLTYRLAATLSKQWRAGDEVIVSRLDHDANVRPWVQAAARAKATVRWAEVDTATGELPAGQYEELLGERTRLVAVSAASNILGTRPDVAQITALAHRAGALTYVDGVHATPHFFTDVKALGADFYATSAYKWCGPHIGAIVASEDLLQTLEPDKLLPSSDEVPDRFETGTLPYADLAGVTEAVEYLGRLGDRGGVSRRERIQLSMTALEEYERSLFAPMFQALGAMPHVTTYGRATRRAPTAYFRVRDLTADEVAARLSAAGINVWSGDNYAFELTTALGIRDQGCAVRASLVHYNLQEDVDRLLDGVASLG